jgi:hypothetical protein
MGAPAAPPAEPPAAEPPSAGGKIAEYVVVRGDSLWKISGKGDIYGDSFQWPLLFINNRDLIKDPDLIKPTWKLNVKQDFASDKVADAVGKAKETPRYVPHTTARKRLPIEY